MTNQPLAGIQVLEVAQYTFVPAAGAVLADWGAEVIKVEHAVTGDAQRGIKLGTGGAAAGSFQPLMEHPNRGKRSIGIALETDAGRRLLDELIERADVFITNFLPGAVAKLRLGVDEIRAVNSDIVYARGSAHGPRGPEAADGGYDLSVFWCRGGGAHGATLRGAPLISPMPAGAYGDSMGGAILAGGCPENCPDLGFVGRQFDPMRPANDRSRPVAPGLGHGTRKAEVSSASSVSNASRYANSAGMPPVCQNSTLSLGLKNPFRTRSIRPENALPV